jgi:hypothetical protein
MRLSDLDCRGGWPLSPAPAGVAWRGRGLLAGLAGLAGADMLGVIKLDGLAGLAAGLGWPGLAWPGLTEKKGASPAEVQRMQRMQRECRPRKGAYPAEVQRNQRMQWKC